MGGTGLYLRAVTDDLSFPGRYPGVAAALTAELDELGPEGSRERADGCGGLHLRLEGLDPLAASRIEPGNERRLVRALEVTIGSGRPFSSFGPGLERYPPSRVTLLGVQRDPEDSDRRIGERFARLMDEGLLDEVRALAARPAGLSQDGPPGPGLPGAAQPHRRRGAADGGRRRGGPADPGLRQAAAGVVPA